MSFKSDYQKELKQQKSKQIRVKNLNSDRAIGALIIIVVIIAAVLYFGSLIPWMPGNFELAVYVVVSIGFLLVLGIGGWIGWTMATTPSPEPIEDLDLEEDFEEEFEEEPEEVVEPVPEAESLEAIEDELLSITGMTENRLESLRDAGYDTLESLREATEEELQEVKGIGDKLAKDIKEKVSQT